MKPQTALFSDAALQVTVRRGKTYLRRSTVRVRTRLACGKLIAREANLIDDCIIYDRSPTGLRVRATHTLPTGADLLFYDDDVKTLTSVTVVWRDGTAIGLRITGKAAGAQVRAIRRRLSCDSYAADD